MNKSPYSPQIIYAYEILGLSPAEVAEQFGEVLSYEETIAILGDNSAKYRAELELRAEKGGLSSEDPNPSGDISEEERLLQEYRILSRSASNELVKERSLKFLIQEAKGRNDLPAKGLALKERQLGLNAINTASRVKEFADAINSIQERLQQTLVGNTSNQKEITI